MLRLVYDCIKNWKLYCLKHNYFPLRTCNFMVTHIEWWDNVTLELIQTQHHNAIWSWLDCISIIPAMIWTWHSHTNQFLLENLVLGHNISARPSNIWLHQVVSNSANALNLVHYSHLWVIYKSSSLIKKNTLCATLDKLHKHAGTYACTWRIYRKRKCNIYIYIYIYRERERERESWKIILYNTPKNKLQSSRHVNLQEKKH